MAEETARMGIGGIGGPPLVEKPSIMDPSHLRGATARPSSAGTEKTNQSDGLNPPNQSQPQRSPKRPSIYIDEVMTIPEAQELTSSTTQSKKELDHEKGDFYHPEALNKV